MNNFPNELKQRLHLLIDQIADYSWLYSTNPGHVFSRKRKLDFATVMKLIISMEGGTLSEEMMEFWNYDLSCPTPSAFVQQRSHIYAEAFHQLLLNFNDSLPSSGSSSTYRILACDGSQVVYTLNPDNTDDYFSHESDDGSFGYNALHLNALYDISNRIFIDAIIQNGVKHNEHEALHTMLDRFEPADPSHTILTVDRGYVSYNLIAQLMTKNMRFVIRAQAPTSPRSLLASYVHEFPEAEEFSVDIERFIVRSRNKIMKQQPSVYLEHKADKHFDYAAANASGKDKMFYIAFRTVKIKLSDNNYEYIITNLPEYDFPIDRIKEIYHQRWDIETSFRQLKYAVGMMNFHSKKVECIKQEIFAKLIVYNFSEIVASQAATSKSKKEKHKHSYALNYSMAAKICHKFLKRSVDLPPPDVIGWLIRNLTVCKGPERSFPRNLRGIGAVSFFYRTT